MNRQQFEQQLQRITTAITSLHGEVDLNAFPPPATAAQIEAVEQALSYRLPTSFRQALLHISSHVYFYWQLPDEVVFDAPHDEIFSGHIEWNLQTLVEMKERIDELIEAIFSEETDAYDAIWQQKLPFLAVGNGDFLAFRVDEEDGAIVYLSHDGSDNHGRVLAQNFEELLHVWGAVGFVGAEDWQWEQLTPSRERGIDVTTDVAQTLQLLLRL